MSSLPQQKWDRRPLLAGTVRVLATVAPILISVVTLLGLGRLWPRPASIGVAIAWWVLLSLTATVVLWAADRWFRRLLPVSALFKLSLVFPDKAPSRFRTALRAGTVRQLKRSVETGNFSRAAPQEAAEQLISLAATLNDHDRQTRGHTERVRAYSVMIGEGMGLEGDDLEFLNWSGLVHDIGKLAVPSEILNKPGKPTEAEWATLRTHPAKADLLIQPLRPWLGMWAESATEHHEWFDGTGYPNGLASSDISLAGRIVAVADAYDVMTSTRSYKKPMSADAARKELAANAGTQFDPEVVRAFLTVSIGRLRLVMGPISSILQFPAGNASLGAAAASGASAATAMSLAVIAGLGSAPVEQAAPPPEIVAMVAPAAADFQITGLEDGTLRADVGANTTDQLTNAYLLSDPTEGRASVSEDGVVTFTPNANFHGDVAIAYEACFADGSCDEATATFTVESVNDAPEANADELTISEDSTAVIDVLANDSDVDGDTIQIDSAEVVSDPSHGLDPDRVTIEGDTIVVEPGRNAWGSTLIRYSIADPAGATDSEDVLLTVTPVNDAPIARNDSVTMIRDSAAVISVMTNDGDVDGDLISITSVALAGNGTATTDGSSVRFVPTAGFTGTANFTYEISDTAGATAQAKTVISVVGPSSQLSLGADTATTLEDQPTVIDVLANDSTPTSALDLTSLRLNALPSNGVAVLYGDHFSYQPDANWEGVDSFGYLVCDLDGGCKTAVVTVTVVGVNDAPSFTAGADPTVTEDSGAFTATGWATAISTGPADEAGQTVAFSVAASDPALFAVQPAINPAGDLTFTPALNANGVATLTVTLTDDGGTLNGGSDTSPAQTATVTITGVNDAPSFTAGADPTVNEDSGAFAAAAWATAISTGPANEAGQTLTFAVTASDPTLFAVQPAINPAGDLTFTPAANSVGTTTITVTVTDDGGGADTSPAQTATVTITGVNDAPVAVADSQSLAEDQVGGISFDAIANDTDLDGDTIVYSSADLSTVVNGTVVDNLDGTFGYTPDEDFNGVETFDYTISDGNGGIATGTVTITVSAAPDAPVAADDSRTTDVDATLTVAAPGVLVNDYDVDQESLTVNTTPVVLPAFGTVTLIPDGSYVYVPNGGFSGTDSFTYEISDPGGLTATATVIITVDSGLVTEAHYFGDSGSSASDYELTTAAPASSLPVFDADGDGSPGLSIKAGDGKDDETDETKFQTWTMAATSPIELSGPVTFDLWAAAKDFKTDKKGHAWVYLYDCLGGTCSTIAETDIHIDPWSPGPADFVLNQIDLGSVSHTVPAGNDLVLRLQFGHEDMWVAMTADYPSALFLTLANSAPVAVADSVTVLEDAPTQNIAVLVNDVDTDLDPASVVVSAAASNGVASPVGDGTINYVPNPDFNGVDSFTYQVCDLGGSCDTATVTVTVTAVNDAPTFAIGGNVTAVGIGASSFPGWASALISGPADEGGQVLTFTITGNDSVGQFASGPTIDAVTGDLTFDALSSGTATITVELSDDGGTANGGADTSAPVTFTITVP